MTATNRHKAVRRGLLPLLAALAIVLGLALSLPSPTPALAQGVTLSEGQSKTWAWGGLYWVHVELEALEPGKTSVKLTMEEPDGTVRHKMKLFDLMKKGARANWTAENVAKVEVVCQKGKVMASAMNVAMH